MTRMRWWGWGEDGHDVPLPAAAAAMLREELGLPPFDTAAVARAPRAPEDVPLPEAALPEAAEQRLRALLGATDGFADDHLARLTHARGRSYPDLLALRSPDGPGSAPDAVVFPGSAAEVAEVLRIAAEEDVAVVPFGGGTSVVGGVEPLRGRHRAVLTLDLSRMDRLVAFDGRAQRATFEAGVFGPDAERLLGAHGLTLGHFPQSFEFSTVGGWVATRSAGQASTGYGRIDELVLALTVVSPAGVVHTRELPATAAGPDLRQLLVGSEGTFGVIADATLRVRPAPRERRYEAWSLPSFEAGAEAMRALEQAESAPAVCRLSDADETRVSLGLAGSRATGALKGYLRVRGHDAPCLLICGHEGDAIRLGRLAAGHVLRRHGAVSLGARPGDAWRRGRFHGPYLRDLLMGHGVLVDTLETATTWDRLPALYAAVRAALHPGAPIVMCHISHVYATGASLYFTFLARKDEADPLGQWRALKGAAGDAIVAQRATITHHHAVGRDHAPWLEPEVGRLGVELLRTVKARLDPANIMNPGKLADDAGGDAA